jgi:hypothetical protein
MIVHCVLKEVLNGSTLLAPLCFAQSFAIVNYIGNLKEWTTFMSIFERDKSLLTTLRHVNMFYFRSGGLFLGW